jgi:hypothetical protein
VGDDSCLKKTRSKTWDLLELTYNINRRKNDERNKEKREFTEEKREV